MVDINPTLRHKILSEIPELQKCFQCGTCVSSCPARIYGCCFSPREFILDCLRGMQERAMTESLWRCVTCNSCNERCPQDVNPYEVIVKLKNIALRDGLVPKDRAADLISGFNATLESGIAYPTTDLVAKRRSELGLQPLRKNDLTKIAVKK
jgi:heterodisulfide reductase subunit C2